jgi:MFS family permease
MFLDSLLALSIGTLLIGTYQAFAQFYRFAASEVSDDGFRPRAISLVLAGGVAAALLGPALAELGGPLLGPRFAGSFLILASISLVAAVLLLGLRVPMPAAERTLDRPRPLIAIMRQPSYATGLFGAATGSGVMVLAMTATPLAMTQDHHSLSNVATVIQIHVLGMFLPAFVTGSLIARFGVLRIMLGGAALLLAHVALTFSGTRFTSFALALTVLGVGWNFLYIGGTTLVTSAYRPAEQARAQAANDLLIFVVGLASALGAGALLHAVGWRLMNAMLLPWLLMAIIALLWCGHARRAREPAEPTKASAPNE